MTVKEVEGAIAQLKAQGLSEQDILGCFYKLFQEDHIDVEELGALCAVLGYELSPDFLAMGEEDQKAKGYEEDPDGSDIEEAKEHEGGEEPEKAPAGGKEAGPGKDGDDEESRVRKLYGYNA